MASGGASSAVLSAVAPHVKRTATAGLQHRELRAAEEQLLAAAAAVAAGEDANTSLIVAALQ
jgi:hypothetical protein